MTARDIRCEPYRTVVFHSAFVSASSWLGLAISTDLTSGEESLLAALASS